MAELDIDSKLQSLYEQKRSIDSEIHELNQTIRRNKADLIGVREDNILVDYADSILKFAETEKVDQKWLSYIVGRAFGDACSNGNRDLPPPQPESPHEDYYEYAMSLIRRGGSSDLHIWAYHAIPALEKAKENAKRTEALDQADSPNPNRMSAGYKFLQNMVYILDTARYNHHWAHR